MQIGIVGINHKLADLHLRDMFAKACARRFKPAYSTHGSQSFVLLSTCNRTEIYFSSEDLAETHSYLLNILRQELQEEFDHKLYSYFGYECFYHLSRVTAGLDSACVAETEIQGQVKSAYEETHGVAKLPAELHYLFQKSLNIGKHIRTEMNLERGLPELDDAVIDTGNNTFCNQEDIKILFVGASSINEKILAAKKLKNVSLMTRSAARGEELEEKYQIKSIPWNPQEWHHYDWVIFGTKSSEYLIKPNEEHKTSSPKLIMDLSVPRNVDPALGKEENITLLNIDQLNQYLSSRQKRLQDSLMKADELVISLSQRQISLYQQKRDSKIKLLALSA